MAWSTPSPTATNREACCARHSWVRAMGFEPIVVANCKRHLDRHQNPTTSAPYAERDGTSVEITTAAGDGTKLQIECAVVANVTGFEPDCRGMHGVPTTLERAVDDLRPIESRDHVVEYTLGGDFGAGVFVVGRTHDHEAVVRSLRFYKMGPGSRLPLLPTPHAGAVRDGRDDRRRLDQRPRARRRRSGHRWPRSSRWRSATCRVGKSLDGIGGFTCYGAIDTTRARERVCSRSRSRTEPCSEPTCPATRRSRSTRSRSTSRRRSSRCVGARMRSIADARRSGGLVGGPPE